MIRRYVFVPSAITPNHLSIEGVGFDVFSGQGQKLAILEIDDFIQNKETIFRLVGATTFLPRIFEKEQQHEYLPEEGQLKPKIENKKRFLSHLFLQENPDLLAEYISLHGKGMVWKEIIENMNTVGVLDMELYLDGYNAFLLMDTKPDFEMEEAGKIWSDLPREQEWQAYVSRFQRTDPSAKTTEKWKNLVRLS